MIDLADAFLVIDSRPEMEAFLVALLSQAELTQCRRRLELFRRILAGEAHRAIAAELKVGVVTVTRAAAAVRSHDPIIRTVFARANREDGGEIATA